MITLTQEFSATPEAVYTAWLSSEGHTAMTGAQAECEPEEGTQFSAWDGYIWGKNVELTPNKKIVQSWRTSEFPENSSDSLLTIEIEPTENGTMLTLNHEGTPQDQEDNYRTGWVEHYFEPMAEYFEDAE